MKSLIRRILKEYVNNDLVTLEEVFFPKGYLKMLTEGEAKYSVPSSVRTKLNNRLKSYFNWPPYLKIGEKNSWCGVDIKVRKLKDEDTEESSGLSFGCSRVFEFELSKHWMQRLFRTKETDYNEGGNNFNKKIKDPELYEGIDLFFNEKNKIMTFVSNALNRNWGMNEEKYIILSKGSGDDIYYELIALVRRTKQIIKVEFITQIKGVKFFDTQKAKKASYL